MPGTASSPPGRRPRAGTRPRPRCRRLAVLADDPGEHRRGRRGARGRGCTSSRRRTAPADVVAHAAVDRHVQARGGGLRHRLTVPTSYRVHLAGPAIARPGSIESRARHVERAALLLDDLREPGQLGGSRVVLSRCRRCRSRRRGRAPAARPSRGHRRAGRAPAGRDLEADVSKICEPMCEWRPTSRSAADAANRRFGLAVGGRSRISDPRARWRCIRGCVPRPR